MACCAPAKTEQLEIKRAKTVNSFWCLTPKAALPRSFTVCSQPLTAQVCSVRARKDHRGVDLVSDALSFGRLWYGEPNAASNAVGYARFYSRLHDAVIRVYDEAGNVIETHEHAGEFKGDFVTRLRKRHARGA